MNVWLLAADQGQGAASSPLLQLGVLVTAIAGAAATVIGAVSASRSKRAAAASTAEAAAAASKHATVEERIVNKDEFAEVVDGLRSIVQTQGEQIHGLERRLTESEAKGRQLATDVAECHDDKRRLRAAFGDERRDLHAQIQELGGTPR